MVADARLVRRRLAGGRAAPGCLPPARVAGSGSRAGARRGRAGTPGGRYRSVDRQGMGSGAPLRRAWPPPVRRHRRLRRDRARHRAAQEALAALAAVGRCRPSPRPGGQPPHARRLAELRNGSGDGLRGPASKRPNPMRSHRKTTLRFSASTSSPTVRGARSGSVTSRPRSSACPTISTGSGASHAAPGSRRGSVRLSLSRSACSERRRSTLRRPEVARHAGSSPPSYGNGPRRRRITPAP